MLQLGQHSLKPRLYQMKYPYTLNHKLAEVREIVNSWSVTLPADEVIKWMMQFDNSDFDLAFRIVKNLNVIGFEDLKNALHVAYGKLERKSIDKGTKISNRNTLFAGIGDGGKSGAMISYNFRLTNELSEENFLDDDSLKHLEAGRIENIVLVDDIISSGTQAVGEIKKLTETLIPLGVKNFFLLTAVGMKEGISKIEDETNAFVFSAFEYDINDTVQSYDSEFYKGLDFAARVSLKERLEYYGKICNPKNPFGFGNVGGLVVFYYNTPNSTIPVIWGFLNSWIPLFKRGTRVNGIDSYYKQFDNLKSQKPVNAKANRELTLFVEGKTDEIFFDLVSETIRKVLEVKVLTVISLGGGFHSEKLIANLERNEKNYLFVIEQDRHAPSSFFERRVKSFKDKPHIYAPPIIEFLKIEDLLADEELQSFLPSRFREESDFYSRAFQRDFEQYILRRPSIEQRADFLKLLLAKHLNQNMLDKLIHNMKVALNGKSPKAD